MRRVQRRPHFPCVHSIFHRNGRTLLGILFQCHYQFFCDSSGMVFGFDSDLQSNLISILLFLPFPLLWASLSWIWSGTWKFCWHFQRFSAVRFDWHPSFEAIFDDSWRLWGCLRISMRFCRDPNPQLRIFSVMIQEFLLIPSHSAGYLKFNWNYHAVWNLSDSMAFDWRHVFSLIILDQSFRNFMVNFEPCFFFSIFFPLAFFFRFLKLYEHPTGRLFDLNWFSINQKKKRKEKKKKKKCDARALSREWQSEGWKSQNCFTTPGRVDLFHSSYGLQWKM